MQHTERLSYILIIFAIILVGIAMWAIFYPKNKTVNISFGGTIIKAKVAKGDTTRNDLLSKPDSLSEVSSVIVDYGDDSDNPRTLSPSILHKDADILWLDGDQKVIYQARSVSGIKSDKEIGPKRPATYLLFLQSGKINKHRINYNDKVNFNLNNLL